MAVIHMDGLTLPELEIVTDALLAYAESTVNFIERLQCLLDEAGWVVPGRHLRQEALLAIRGDSHPHAPRRVARLIPRVGSCLVPDLWNGLAL